MRYARIALCAVAFMASFGLAAAQTPPLAKHIRVVSPSHLDIMSNGKFSGKISLAVGTQLDVDGAEGEYLLVHIHMMHGRVLAKDTDINGAAAPAEAAQRPALQQPAAQAPSQAASPARASPAVSPRPDVAVYPQGTRPRTDPGAATVPIVFFAATLLASFLLIAGYWRLFTKAGKPGWAILIPIYNMIVMQQLSGKPLWWMILYFVPLVNIIIAVICTFALAENFGRGKGYGLGMLLLPWIFVPMLAFGDAEFVGTTS